MAKLEFNTPYLNDYMAMVEDTESPRIMHLWSAIWAVSSALGRRCYLPFGTFDIYPNHYSLLIGTPGTRKTTAANIAKRLVKQATGVRFAPSDTGFQRQGLVLALQGAQDENRDLLDSVALAAAGDSISSLTQLNELTMPKDEDDGETHAVFDADKHHIAICASEFSRVIGQNNHAMLDFLGERYDGEDYEYQTRQSHIKLKHTLINMIACSTPSSIATSLPPQAGGQGFLSRIVLVYGAKKYKQVPRPRAPDELLVGRVKEVISDAYYKLAGAFSEEDGAESYCESLYDYVPEITDSRFVYYAERRFSHLLKLAMVLAAARGTLTISRADYEEAHRILRATEVGMPEALGEFGMNPLAAIKQEILEQLRAAQGPLSFEQVVAMFSRDARSNEIAEVINDLVRSKLVLQTQLPGGARVLMAKVKLHNTEDAMMSLLAER